ncbi:NERD domain-containing protein [Paenibacillus sambharensis]|uniref:NERD domain-containing protein n=1 Tax=Paenibacillus sambharensis TaxID=1803190 RepID=A0A2W1LDA1_9BACL|nr:nuclease-related domain-containing protein [Paenibacillus sambharensis]PZD93025.1 NERD domain-containing protein [Paenibacillus sambharensis]
MLGKLLAIFKGKSTTVSQAPIKKNSTSPKHKRIESTRIGELGEHKINIQLDQLPKDCKYLSDLLIPNAKSRTGYAQIDHVVISPYGLFVIETKNYNGEIKGGRSDKQWSVSNRFKMYNPLMQNYGHIKALESHLGKINQIKYISIISFTMRCRFSIDPDLRKIHSDELIVYDVELSEFIGRKLKRLEAEHSSELLTEEDINQIYNTLNRLNITDSQTKAEHVEKIKRSKG